MPERLRILNTRRDFLAATENVNGLHLLTNVSFDYGEPETVRLNMGERTYTLRRATAQSPTPRGMAPFDILSPSILLTAEQLAGLQDNFAVVHRALELGDGRLSQVSIRDPANQQILPRIQICAAGIITIDRLLTEQLRSTPLCQAYLQHPKWIPLMQQDELSAPGRHMLAGFNDAVDTYAAVPELRDYFDQGQVRQGNLGPRGERFRKWLQGHQTIATDGMSLDFVAYALRPLRIAGNLFAWNHQPGDGVADLRLLTVDLLLRFENQPVWCEFKAKGDAWTSSALQQILLYGSMLCSGNQVRRCHHFFLNQFQAFRPWLGIVVEEQNDARFVADFDQALRFIRHEEAQHSLRNFLEGFVFVRVRETDGAWSIAWFDVIRW